MSAAYTDQADLSVAGCLFTRVYTATDSAHGVSARARERMARMTPEHVMLARSCSYLRAVSGPPGARTRHLGIKSPLLYPMS
jgi:hypothetical protein